MIEIIKKIGFVIVIMSMFVLLSCEDHKIASKEDGEKQFANVKLDGTEEVKVTDIGVDILKKSFENKNIMISPVSIIEALSMTENGADGKTLNEMETTFSMSLDQMNKYFTSYNKAHTDNMLFIANSIWMNNNEDIKIEEEFIKKNEDYYNAEIYKKEFNQSTLKDMNEWTSEKTNQMIPEIINDINKAAVMYLINAVCFKADWEEEYKDINVFDSEFTLENGSKKQIEMMYSKEHIYLEDNKAKGMIKYYKDRKYAFIALLPNENIKMKDYLDSLNASTIKELIKNKKEEEVVVNLPKFKSEYSARLKNILIQMGIKDAFDIGKANFKKMGSILDGNIYIEDVIHKTFIEVDEKGTKAAAATAVVMVGGSMPPEEEKKLIFDRPFIYMIYDLEFNIPVFIGVEMEI